MSERAPITVTDGEVDHDLTDPASWDHDPGSEILNDLHSLLAGLDSGNETVDADVGELVRSHGELVYSELIYMLSHLRFLPVDAKPHWELIIKHRRSMAEKLDGTVDLRVALVSYFLEVNRQLRNPKIIEMQLFESERDSAYRDMLTGLYNYRLFREHLAREIFRADRYSKPLSLVMIDVDHFKPYNDGAGHEAGNHALQEVAKLITGSLRKTDFAARYGGDEFALILPATAKTSANL
jgi:GGDEF domain-containing protein